MDKFLAVYATHHRFYSMSDDITANIFFVISLRICNWLSALGLIIE